jgi:gliding motility-associated-like protein
MTRPIPIKRNTLLLFLLLPLFLSAINPNVKNIGFENGFAGWIGKTWIYTTSNPKGNTQPQQVTLPNDPRIVLMSDPSAYDNCTGNKLKIIPEGYKFSARLGAYKDAHTNNINGRDQSLEYTLKVDPTNELLTIKFAVVLEIGYNNSGAHAEPEQPRFTITLLDNAGNSIPSLCSSFDETALSLDKVQSSTSLDGQPIAWRDWKTVSANLKKMEGQEVTIKFTTMDCTPGGHFGYAYIVVDTQPLYITTKYCSGNDDAVLTAPDGFASYTWKNNGKIVGSDYQCKIPNAKEGDEYTCVFMTESQCFDSLSTTIKRIQPTADFKFSTIDCTSSTNTVQFTNSSVADVLHPSDTFASLTYQWDFGEGGSCVAADTTYTFSTSGWQKVNLKVTSYPSTCTASKDTLIETFYPPLIGIKGDATYCPDHTTTLRGYGADHYRWIEANGQKTGIQDTLAVGNPGGKVGLIGYATNEICNTTKYITISEEPTWTLNVGGSPYFCFGSSTTLVASGNGSHYSWSGQKTADPSITITAPGNYDITATNRRGCKLSQTINVKEISLPATQFQVAPSIINTKYNQITGSITLEEDIEYSWEMGDNLNEHGSSITHRYTGNGEIGKYTIMLHAINSRYGCTDSASQSVIMEPFVPNVFTPNGDSHNDYFMPKYEIEIFDRQGIVVYKGTTNSEGWDGTYKGRRAEPDTYFYILHYFNYLKEPKTRKGYVTLIR